MKVPPEVMAHRKFEHDKIETTMPTWHGLESRCEVITLENNWLRDWDLVPTPLFFQDLAPAMSVEADDDNQGAQWTLSRCTDNAKIQIGAPYNPATFRPISNGEFLSLVEQSISGTDHKIVSVGSVRNRGRVFLSIELQGMEKFKAGGREFSAFLNYGNGHDKSSVLWVNTSNICTVCDNTFSANLFEVENKRKDSQTDSKDDLKIRVRHTKNAAMRFPAIAQIVDKAIGVQAEFALAMEGAEKVSLNADSARKLFAGFVAPLEAEKLSTRAENTVDRLVMLFSHGNGNQGRNLGDAFHAVTDYYTHESAGGENKEKQFLSSEFGSAGQRKQDFFSLLRDDKKRTMGEKLAEVSKRGESLLATV